MNQEPRYKTLDEFYIAVSRYKRAHNNELPPEPLHFTRIQWSQFCLDRKAIQAIVEGDLKGEAPSTIYGLQAERYRDLKELQERANAIDNCPELWPAQWTKAA